MASLRFLIANMCRQYPLIIHWRHQFAITFKTFTCYTRVQSRDHVKYPSNRVKEKYHQKLSSVALEEDWTEESTELEQAEDFVYEHGLFGGKSPNQIDRKLEGDRKRTKMAIMRKKYFKDIQETSLLTWEAKEQIRFLHQDSPDIWTIEKLSKSFPVSQYGLKAILQSSYKPKNDNELQNYNERTRKRWLALKACLGKEGGPVNDPEFRELLQQNKVPLMINASGIKQLPVPKHVSKNYCLTADVERPGIYESIVKDYKEAVVRKTQDTKGKKLEASGNEVSGDEVLLLTISEMGKGSGTVAHTLSARSGVDVSDRPENTVNKHVKPSRRQKRLALNQSYAPISVDLTNMHIYQTVNTRKITKKVYTNKSPPVYSDSKSVANENDAVPSSDLEDKVEERVEQRQRNPARKGNILTRNTFPYHYH